MRMACLRTFVVTSAILSIGVALNRSSAQVPRDNRSDPIQQVSRLAELVAASEPEKQLARAMNWGFVPISPGVVRGRSEPVLPLFGPGSPTTPEGHRRLFACGSHAILIGHLVRRPKTILNQRGTDLVTVFEFDVDRWVWPARDGARVVVGRPGGRVLVGSEEYFSAPPTGMDTYPSLGQSALLLLKKLGATEVYLFGYDVLPIDGGKLEGVDGEFEALLAAIRDSAQRCAKGVAR